MYADVLMLSFKTPSSVCFDAGNYSTVNSNGMEVPSPEALRPSSLSSLFLFIYMPLYHKPVQRASGSSWVCGHNTESATSKVPPSSPQRREESKEGGRRREKIWDKFCFTHTHRKSVYAHGKIAAHICGVAMRIHQSLCPDRFTRAYSLTLAPTLISFLFYRPWQDVLSSKVCSQCLLY